MTDLETFIVTTVADKGPIKGVDLALEVVTHNHDLGESEIHDALQRLVKDGEIIEMEYILPSMNYRTKSMFFPKGTQLSRAL